MLLYYAILLLYLVTAMQEPCLHVLNSQYCIALIFRVLCSGNCLHHNFDPVLMFGLWHLVLAFLVHYGCDVIFVVVFNCIMLLNESFATPEHFSAWYYIASVVLNFCISCSGNNIPASINEYWRLVLWHSWVINFYFCCVSLQYFTRSSLRRHSQL